MGQESPSKSWTPATLGSWQGEKVTMSYFTGYRGVPESNPGRWMLFIDLALRRRKSVN
jgi:hypothetical protein